MLLTVPGWLWLLAVTPARTNRDDLDRGQSDQAAAVEERMVGVG